jgi:hypothetical protein
MGQRGSRVRSRFLPSVRSRTPGSSPSVNSMPAPSRAPRSFVPVSSRPPNSIRCFKPFHSRYQTHLPCRRGLLATNPTKRELNGIEDVISRPNLADRSIFLTLPPVADARRQSERELWRRFERARPRILGALLDMIVHGMRTLPGIDLDRLPRMADFALWATERLFGLLGPSAAPMRQTAELSSRALSIPTRSPLACVMAERSSWTGSAAELLRAGAARSGDGTSRDSTGWPKNPRALAGRLRRAQTFLRVLGIDITFSREGQAGNRIIRMRATTEHTVSTVSTVGGHGPRVRTTCAATGP